MWEPQRGLLFSGTDIRGCYLVQRANKPTKKGQLILFLCEWTYLASVDIHLHTSRHPHPMARGLRSRTKQTVGRILVLVNPTVQFKFSCSVLPRYLRSFTFFSTLYIMALRRWVWQLVSFDQLFTILFLILVPGLLLRSGSIPFLGLCHLGFPRGRYSDRSSYNSCSLRSRRHYAGLYNLLENHLWSMFRYIYDSTWQWVGWLRGYMPSLPVGKPILLALVISIDLNFFAKLYTPVSACWPVCYLGQSIFALLLFGWCAWIQCCLSPQQ